MHTLIGTVNGIGGAGFDAQSAADAPVFVDEGHAAQAFYAEFGIQRHDSSAGNYRQARYALGPAWRALVDGCVLLRNGLRIGRAIGIAAARALGLRQRIQDARSERVVGVRCGCHRIRIRLYPRAWRVPAWQQLFSQ